MASVGERLGEALEREAPVWGIRPVPSGRRRFSNTDVAVLWGDLSIGLLVLVSGALLVPALGLRAAAAAIAIGSVIGCAALGFVGAAGAREGVPGMVLFRPVLGRRGSYLPSAANLVQLVGWTAFEFWAMARVGNAVTSDLFGIDAWAVWLVTVAVVCTALALAGPVFTVRRWLERFGAWVVGGVAIWITVRVLAAGDLGELWARPGAGGLPFWAAVDLVIAMPISWLPLVADFNRFARDERGSAAATFASYGVGNAWFYLLGALLVLVAGADPDVLDIGSTVAATAGGAVVLLALLVGESDQAMANLYSGAVSVQNVAPAVRLRPLIVGLGVAGLAIAAALSDAAATFEVFLFLIGSVFVPLFGVFVADLARRGWRYGEAALFEAAPDGIRWRAVIAWAAGFALYQWCVPTGPAWWVDGLERVVHDGLGLPVPLLAGSPIGASLPAVLAAFVLGWALLRPPSTPGAA
jgi:putative hydroxymethylpyrimidine transporter CytX